MKKLHQLYYNVRSVPKEKTLGRRPVFIVCILDENVARHQQCSCVNNFIVFWQFVNGGSFSVHLRKKLRKSKNT